jgi:hypothetical protein
MVKATVLEKRYLVGIPIPSLDMRGQPLHSAEVETWTQKTLDELTACFGGATPIPAPGLNVVQDRTGKPLTLFEHGQTLVLSGCSSRTEFRSKRPRIRRCAEKMATSLHPQAVFVLAFPSDSFLIEVTGHPRRQRERRRRRV